MAHTYAELSVSEEAYNEIKGKLEDAGYKDSIEDDVIDMHGIALIKEGNKKHRRPEFGQDYDDSFFDDFSDECEVCGAKPVDHTTGMCFKCYYNL